MTEFRDALSTEVKRREKIWDKIDKGSKVLQAKVMFQVFIWEAMEGH